ncbi:hypothetical protein ACFVGV_06110 [Pseudarthrobacter scleromae]|uniref:hypothetical protein n=1 Tax=Pseudarthrobacter scleromae TaxID=158897 RepID=UPI0036358E4B
MPNDWRLAYPGEDLAFGSIASRLVFTSAPDLGSLAIRHDDADRPRADGVVFGEDFFGGRTITFDVSVAGEDEAHARELLGRMARAWRADVVRRTPGAVATLVSDSGRIAFGRPRRFASTDELLPEGMSQVIADFATADSVWYGPEHSVSVDLQPRPGGGLLAPLASPLATTSSSDRSTVFTVAGDVDTWPVFEIQGPITNPVVEIVDRLRMEFRTTLAYDETLVVDTRPWGRSILRDGASLAGSLSRASTRLSQAALPPGRHELVLRGLSEAGTARVNARWRDAYLTP